ncbi:MAG: hypothetical protein IJO63_05520 [Bacilli bacterium]|nr:hypothetical protein [Bacilli bacterium]
MKQTIEYYYSLKLDKLFIEGDAYHFILDDSDYYFVFCNRTIDDLKEIVECSRQLKEKNVICHDIILNNKQEVITKIEDVNYILLKVANKDRELSIVEIIEQNKKTKLSSIKTKLYRNDWANLWSKKIDYIESQLNEVEVDRVVRKSIDYYIGLTENAIYYVTKISQLYNISENDNVVLSHRRIYYPNTNLNYANPLTFIFDLEVRDVAEYIKSLYFYNETDAFLELQTYLKSVSLTQYSYNMLFARLLYPSYYFDCYEKIVNKKQDSECLIKIISKVDNYENFIRKAYNEISLYAKLEKINWLIY